MPVAPEVIIRLEAIVERGYDRKVWEQMEGHLRKKAEAILRRGDATVSLQPDPGGGDFDHLTVTITRSKVRR